MNGAESLVRTLVASGVDVSFTNPGTSEMHFVAALDRVEGMRCVLGLFEGVVTGMADGYARMTGRPAATLLHLGPGFGNGIANLHNARRAHSPIVNIVGDHATFHVGLNAPLTADIEGLARPVSHWVRTSGSARQVARDGAEAVRAARTGAGRTATLILPADTAWNDAGSAAADPLPVPPRAGPDPDAVRTAASALLSGAPALIHMTGQALHQDALRLAGRIQARTGCRLSCMTSNGRWQRGAGRVFVERIQYPVDVALRQLRDVRHIILLGTDVPVAFFAYPDKPGVLLPEGCDVHRLAGIDDDHLAVLQALVDELDAEHCVPDLEDGGVPDLAGGALVPEAMARALGRYMPEDAIVVDESVTSGRGFMPYTRGAAPHDWLALTGGSIGYGLPCATGAALACPDRRVICTEGDGSAMYTLQALWTQAREGCNVTTVLFNNRSYAILKGELANVGAGNPGRTALDMLELDRPDLDWCRLAGAMGVPASRATTAEAFNEQFARAVAEPGPSLIEAVM